MKNFRSIPLVIFYSCVFYTAPAQTSSVDGAVTSPSLSQQMAATTMNTWKDSFSFDNKPVKWTYDQGVILKGIEGAWNNTGDGKYFKYIQQSMDFFVDKDGHVKTYK